MTSESTASANGSSTNGSSKTRGSARRTSPSEPSDKTRKFREIGEPRVNRAIKSIQLLGNLSNKSAYDPTPEDVAKMLKALRSAVQDLEDRFSKGKKKSNAFSF